MIPKNTKLKSEFDFPNYYNFEKLWLQIYAQKIKMDSQDYDMSLSYKENKESILKYLGDMKCGK